MAVAAAVGLSTSATARRIPSIPKTPPSSVRRSVIPSVTRIRRSSDASWRSVGVTVQLVVAGPERRVNRALEFAEVAVDVTEIGVRVTAVDPR
jgi:hypothetical protein